MPSPRYVLTDRIYGGRLAEQLEEWATADVSYEAMARLITQYTGWPISGQTIRRWIAELRADGDDGEGEAA